MRASPRAVAALVALVGLTAYLSGVAPDVLYADGGELQAAGIAGGIAHPSGYPTFILLGQGFGKLLPGIPAWRMNVMSAGCGAAGLGLFALVLAELGLSTAAVLAGAVIYGASFTYWRNALGAEVYTLAIALFLLALWRTLVALRTRRLDDACAAAYFMGLAVTGHLVFGPPVVLMATGVALSLPLSGGRRLGAWTLLVAAFAIGLSPYAYLAFADRQFTATNYLRTTIELSAHQFGLAAASFASPLPRVMWVLFGSESHPVQFARPPGGLLRNGVTAIAQLVLFELGPLAAGLAAIGAWRIARRRGPERFVLAALGASGLAFAAAVTQLRLIPIFMMPALLAAGALVGAGVDAVLERIPRSHPSPPGIRAAGGLLVGAAVALLVIPWPHLLRVRAHAHPIGPLRWQAIEESDPSITGLLPSLRGRDEARRFGERVLRALPPNAYAIGKWRNITVLNYLHTVEGRRPDLTLDPWYDAHVARLERWQAEHDIRDHPFVVVGAIPELRGLLGAADSVAFGEGDYLLVRRAPLVLPHHP